MVIQGSHVQVIFTQTFQYRQIAEALKIFIYIWKRTEEGTSSFSKVVEGTAVFTKVVEASASFTKVAKSVPTWSKEVESASTWTKDTEPPAVTEVPDD